MLFKNVKLVNFRLFDKKEIEFDERINIIHGRNGSGKSSLLESLWIICTGKSFRNTPDSYIIKYNREFYKIESTFFLKNGEKKEVKIIYTINGEKELEINGLKDKRLGELVHISSSVIFLPEDMQLIDGPPEIRRKFLNMFISLIEPQYYDALIRYNKLLEMRNFILKEEKINKDEFEAITENFVNYGVYISKLRLKYLKELKKVVIPLIKDFLKKEVLFFYKSNITNKVEEITKEEFFRKLKGSYQKERALGHTIIGPHRDDVIIAGKYGLPISYTYSSGEKRSIVLFLKFGEALLMEKLKYEMPVVLMDDIMGELDSQNKRLIIDYIKKMKSQFLITSTSLTDYKGVKDAKIINI